MPGALLKTHIRMGCTSEVARTASNGQARNENIDMFIKLILSAKVREWCKGHWLFYPDKRQRNLKSDNFSFEAKRRMQSSISAKVADSSRSSVCVKTLRQRNVLTSGNHQTFHGSSFSNYRNRIFSHHRNLTQSFSRSYSTANESRKASSNEYSWEPGPSVDPDSVTTSSILHDKEEDQCKSKYVITTEEFERVIAKLQFHLPPQSNAQGDEVQRKCSQGSIEEDWVLEWEGSGVVIWSRAVEGKEYLQYKIQGHYEDIPPIAFFYIQMNLAHRQHWDSSTDAIELFDARDGGNTELVYWRVNFPRLMAKRDYTIARRHLVDIERNVMVLYNRAVSHPDRPINKKYVRVTDFDSQMLIRPEKGITQNGFDFTLIYTDDTKTNMPQYALRRLVRSGLPQFLGSIHQASRTLTASYRKFKSSGEDISLCRDERVKELSYMIEQAEGAELRRQLCQSSEGDYMEPADGDECEEEEAGVSVDPPKYQTAEVARTRVLPTQLPLRKINPPEYLPDWRAYVEGVLADGRLTPIPLKRVHSPTALPKHQPPSSGCYQDWSP